MCQSLINVLIGMRGRRKWHCDTIKICYTRDLCAIFWRISNMFVGTDEQAHTRKVGPCMTMLLLLLLLDINEVV